LTAAATEFVPPSASAGRSLWYDAWLRFRRNKLAMFMLAIVGVYVVVGISVAAGWLAADWDVSVGPSYAAPSWEHPFGTDIFGQSVFRKMIYGTKISLSVAFFAALLSIGIGVPLGAAAGFFGGIIDEVIVWLYSTLSSIPGLLLILAFAYALQDRSLFGFKLAGITSVYLALGLTSWVGLCRLIRGEVMKHKNRDYVTAATAYGASKARIIFRHVIPNVTHLILIDFSLRFVGFIHAEVILSFLGLGAKSEPSWGVMIDDARLELSRGYWWQMTAATIAIFGISLALNIAGDALRDALDPKIRT
jgi:peptide/nickel transport system permease protein